MPYDSCVGAVKEVPCPHCGKLTPAHFPPYKEGMTSQRCSTNTCQHCGWTFYTVRYTDGTTAVKKSNPCGGGCHITKVVLYARGLSDDCYELNTLRKFRDEYLNKEGFSEEVKDYYENSAMYAKCIEKKAKSNPKLYDELYEKYVNPAIRAIEKNNMKKAHKILREYLNLVKVEFCNKKK